MTEQNGALERLAEWVSLKQRAAQLVEQERAMRAALFQEFFPNPVEGTNKFDLPHGYVLKATYPLKRSVDEGALDALRSARARDHGALLSKLGISTDGASLDVPLVDWLRLPVDQLVRSKPELSVKAYRTLTAEQQAVFDLCLVSTPGSASLEVCEPPQRRAAALAGEFV